MNHSAFLYSMYRAIINVLMHVEKCLYDSYIEPVI